LKWYAELVNKMGKGMISIKILGGPEVIPAFGQHEAVKKGVIDMCVTSPTFYRKLMPEAPAFGVLGLTIQEERSSGFVDFFDKTHNEKMNAHYLGRANWHHGYYLWSSKKFSSVPDMVGLKIRAMASHEPIVQAVGGVSVVVTTAEAYSALERGVVDGIAANIGMIYTNKIYEVLKYRYGTPNLMTTLAIIHNLDTWNGLSKAHQDLMTEAIIEIENKLESHFRAEEVENMKEMEAGGIEIVPLTAAEQAAITKSAYDYAWGMVKDKVSPESYAALQKFAGR